MNASYQTSLVNRHIRRFTGFVDNKHLCIVFFFSIAVSRAGYLRDEEIFFCRFLVFGLFLHYGMQICIKQVCQFYVHPRQLLWHRLRSSPFYSLENVTWGTET